MPGELQRVAQILLDQLIPYAMTNTSTIQSPPVPNRLPAIPTD